MAIDTNPAAAAITVRLAGRADTPAIYALIKERARARDALHEVRSSLEDVGRDGFRPDPALALSESELIYVLDEGHFTELAESAEGAKG